MSFFGHGKSIYYFAVFCLHLHSEKMSWLRDDICRYIILIGTNGSYVRFFASVLLQSAWLCIWPDPKVIFFVWLFRILAGPGFCMRFILQSPGWVWGKFRPEWAGGAGGHVFIRGGSWAEELQANLPVYVHGHTLHTPIWQMAKFMTFRCTGTAGSEIAHFWYHMTFHDQTP